ncbi:MAG: hypothetical protein QF430_08395 [Candidatus Marinimicrobia bacterium]|nr:hypothetical protein [Candidatus Neomarinimicrobiota bacterium]
MTLLTTIVLLFVFAVPVIFAVQPMLGPRLTIPQDTGRSPESLKRKKQLLYRQIKELELEHGLGLVPENEFNTLRQELKKQVSEIMEAIRKHS